VQFHPSELRVETGRRAAGGGTQPNQRDHQTDYQNTWTHSALYIGRLFDIDDKFLQARIRAGFEGDPGEQLLIEALLGEGTIISPISKYHNAHLRICRPSELEPADAQRVIDYAIRHLGSGYDMRHLLDLARFFLR